MMHLWATQGTGRYPVCGASTPGKGPVATQYDSLSDLCPACRAYQARVSLAITRRIRRKRGKPDV